MRLPSAQSASKQIQSGNVIAAINELGSLVNKINAVITGGMATDAAEQLTDTILRIQSVLRM